MTIKSLIILSALSINKGVCMTEGSQWDKRDIPKQKHNPSDHLFFQFAQNIQKLSQTIEQNNAFSPVLVYHAYLKKIPDEMLYGGQLFFAKQQRQSFSQNVRNFGGFVLPYSRWFEFGQELQHQINDLNDTKIHLNGLQKEGMTTLQTCSGPISISSKSQEITQEIMNKTQLVEAIQKTLGTFHSKNMSLLTHKDIKQYLEKNDPELFKQCKNRIYVLLNQLGIEIKK